MPTNRLESFSDGVIAIIITVMLLNMQVPQSADIESLRPLIPIFICYFLSFLYLAIYWNNYHHMLQATQRTTGGIMWANMHFLFWLSLLPFVTAWMGENHFSPIPTGLYGIVLLLTAIAYFILQYTIICSEGPGSLIKKAVGKDWKGKASIILYILGILLSSLAHWSATFIYFFVAFLWLVPDKRIERMLGK